jgi:hypothetical protein
MAAKSPVIIAYFPVPFISLTSASPHCLPPSTPPCPYHAVWYLGSSSWLLCRYTIIPASLALLITGVSAFETPNGRIASYPAAIHCSITIVQAWASKFGTERQSTVTFLSLRTSAANLWPASTATPNGLFCTMIAAILRCFGAT